MNHIKLYEKFVTREDPNIYEADSPEGAYYPMSQDIENFEKNLELKKEIYKTWINDYVIPLMDVSFEEQDPRYKSLISSAKAWLGKYSGVQGKDSKGNLVNFTNGEIVYYLYWEKRFAKEERTRFPLLASMYDLIKGKPA
jgi:hypothetical protein